MALVIAHSSALEFVYVFTGEDPTVDFVTFLVADLVWYFLLPIDMWIAEC